MHPFWQREALRELVHRIVRDVAPALVGHQRDRICQNVLSSPGCSVLIGRSFGGIQNA